MTKHMNDFGAIYKQTQQNNTPKNFKNNIESQQMNLHQEFIKFEFLKYKKRDENTKLLSLCKSKIQNFLCFFFRCIFHFFVLFFKTSLIDKLNFL